MTGESRLLILAEDPGSQSASRGATDVLTDALRSTSDASLTVTRATWQEALDLTRSRSDANPVIFTQQEGGLSADYGRWAIDSLGAGARVVELNVFNKPSPHRPLHPRYDMALYTADGADRVVIRSRAAGFRLPQTYLPLANVLSRTGARLPTADSGHRLLRVVRIGRPDPTKWSHWEIEYCNLLAQVDPSRQVSLTLVGYPWPGDSIGATQPNLTVAVVPATSDVASFYETNDLYLHHSRIGETYGNTVAEAWQAGLAVVNACDIAWDTAPLDYLPDDQAIVATIPWLRRNVDDVIRMVDDELRQRRGDAPRAEVGLSTGEYLSRLLNPEVYRVGLHGATEAARRLTSRVRRVRGVGTGARAVTAEVYRGAKARRTQRGAGHDR